MYFEFANRCVQQAGSKIDDGITQSDIKNTPGLFRASIEDALTYGGELTRHALGKLKLVGEHKHIVVDAKTHMLMPGMIPAIPGWHTDGVPRTDATYSQKGLPHLKAQIDSKSPNYHLMVVGDTTTEFVDESLILDFPEEPFRELYSLMNNKVKVLGPMTKSIHSGSWYSWDWWSIHRAVKASVTEWRYLIRVAEIDHLEPNKDLRDILRNQQQVYLTEDYGW